MTVYRIETNTAFFKNSFIALLLVLCVINCPAQTVINISSCDTTITDPTANVFSNNTILTVNAPAGSRLCYNVEQFNNNYSSVNIYNGPGTSSPLITTLGDPFSLPNQLFGGQTTGNAITLQFFGIGNGSIIHFKMRIRCVQAVSNIPTFQPLPPLPAAGNIKKADYDNDGDEDLIVGGHIFRNDSYFDSLYLFERKANVLSGWVDPNLAEADFDNDGFKDIFITGSTAVFGGLLRPVAAIYHNNGNGTFTLATPESAFMGAKRGACNIVDFNNDGKPDICYTGATQSAGLVFKVYINNGNMSFTDANIILPGLSGLIEASLSWADSDGDGDLDLLINGNNGPANTSALFIRSGNTFTNKNLNLTPTSYGALSWIDFNMDGKPDILNTGVASAGNINAIVPEIFFNTGNNSFTKVSSNLPALTGGCYDWHDYDGDNDQDIVIDGTRFNPATGDEAAVYKNIGNGQFTKIGIDGAVGTSRVKWIDFNNDGKKDIVGIGGHFIKYMGADSFKISSFNSTYRPYNEESTLISDVNNDGLVDILLTGSMADVDCNASVNASTLVMGRVWRLSGVPKFTQTADLTTMNPIVQSGFITEFYYQWGDFDSDGKMDVLMTGDNSAGTAQSFLIVYKNNGNNNFSIDYNSRNTPLPPYSSMPSIRYAGVFDIDNDGINELFIFPNSVYKRVNNQWQLSYSETTTTPGTVIYSDFGDYNNDGFTDVVVSSVAGAAVFRNDGKGRLVNISTPFSGYSYGIIGRTALRQIQWADMDNDGDLDIVSSEGNYENRNGNFVFISSQTGSFLHAAAADFNEDGMNDLVRVMKPDKWGSLTILYNQQGKMFFSPYEAGYPTTTTSYDWNPGVVSYDLDKDGDMDFVYSGSLCNGGTSVVVNEGSFNDRKLYVTAANGGETWNINDRRLIKWAGYQIGNSVKIEISRDSGNNWQLVTATANSTAGGGSYTWTVTGALSNKCLIRITDNTAATFTDISNAVFKIAAPLAPVANAGPDTTICEGSSLQIGSPQVGTHVYSWTSSPPGFVSAVANPFVQPAVSTSYFLKVTDGTATVYDTIKVTVAAVSGSLPDTLKACKGLLYNIGISTLPQYNYSWTSNPAGFTSTLANPVITANISTTYYLNIHNLTNGCRKTDSIFVKVDSCGKSNQQIFIYPNPAKDVLHISGLLLTMQWEKLDVYDISGRKALSTVDISGITAVTLPTGNLYKGVYFVILKNGRGEKAVFKFLKE